MAHSLRTGSRYTFRFPVTEGRDPKLDIVSGTMQLIRGGVTVLEKAHTTIDGHIISFVLTQFDTAGLGNYYKFKVKVTDINGKSHEETYLYQFLGG